MIESNVFTNFKTTMATLDNTKKEALEMLLYRVGQGDRAAFSQLYEQTSAKLLGVSTRILLRRDLAEEALQDAFVNIWHHAAEYRSEKAAVMTWLTSIVRNKSLDILRAMPHEAELDEDKFEEWASEDLTPLQIAAQNSDTKALLECMKSLTPIQRQAIAMSYFHGLAHEQLSERLTQPLGTVKTWIRRGLLVLKDCMSGIDLLAIRKDAKTK